MRLLLDTNVLLWVLNGSPRISKVRDLILASDTDVFVSLASLWEITIKVSLGKLEADLKVIRRAIEDSGFLELSITGSHLESLSNLPQHHRDPFDRLIVAQAMTEPMRLITGDGALAAYTDLVMTI